MRHTNAAATTLNALPSTPVAQPSDAMANMEDTMWTDARSGDTEVLSHESRGLPVKSINHSVNALGRITLDGEGGANPPPLRQSLRETVEWAESRRPTGQDLVRYITQSPPDSAIALAVVKEFIPYGIRREFPLPPTSADDSDHPQLVMAGPFPATCLPKPPPPPPRPAKPDYNRPTEKKAESFSRPQILPQPSSSAHSKQCDPAPTKPRHGQPLPRWSQQNAFGLDINQPRSYAFGGDGDNREEDQVRAQYDDGMGKEGDEQDRPDEWGEGEKRRQGGLHELKPGPALAQAFFPVGSDRPQVLGFAQFDDELLRNVRNLNVPVLHDATWLPNSDGPLSGGFGHVEKASWNNQDIGVKFLKGTQTESGTARGKRSFLREVIAWSKLTHPNILPFLGVVCADKYLGMASAYMPNGCAPKYIAKHPDANVLQILCDVALGLRHLAAQNPPIAHGDLKGSNVLIDQNGRACICDFGLSKFIKDFKSIDTRNGGTIRWMAPEQILSETFMVSLSADIFSWGMLSFELMTGSVPWQEVQQDAAIVVKVAVRNQRPARPTCKTRRCHMRPRCACLIGNDELWDLIQKCWRWEPDERPTAAQLCEVLIQEPTDENHT